MLGIRRQLREASARWHERVDAAYEHFDLGDRASYSAFLSAHARVLPTLERALDGHPAPWRPRARLLSQDLADLGCAIPLGAPQARAEGARAWGMLYVLEGSRFGGAMLARRVAPGAPRRYLEAGHSAESWRWFEQALETAGADHGEAWLEDAIGGARHTFDLFERAAAHDQGRVC